MAALGPLIQCYACDNQATHQCRRCARVYCQLHGGDLCAECLSPASSLPSFNLYRGSLLALLIGTAVAIWLIVRPPGSGNGGEVIISQVTPTAIVSQGTRTPTAGSPTVATPGTPTPGTPQPTETPAPRTYEVQDGDTLIGIAEQFAPPGVDPFAYAQQIASANGIGSDQLINPGDVLTLP
jgi:LysM repeat protein